MISPHTYNYLDHKIMKNRMTGHTACGWQGENVRVVLAGHAEKKKNFEDKGIEVKIKLELR
jgi:hypothetical protein